MMDYIALFKERNIQDSEEYPRNDIGIAKLFFDLHSSEICYVVEAKSWYVYKVKRWIKDEGGLWVMERCKDFAQAYGKYAEIFDDGSEESKAFVKYAAGFHSRRKREGLLNDAKSIAPRSLAAFDRDRSLFNCQNGTLCLTDMVLRPHRPTDYLTKISRVKYNKDAVCERWEQFISEVMCGDAETARFLQKAFGYCLSGETTLECFFILYGNTTRNGKSTLTETIGHIFGDYARTAQPQSLSRRPSSGAEASPDTARLKGARLVNVSEPEKGLELNVALVKQLTGGDTYTARNLHESPIEFKPEFKIFINTNHLPRTADDTVFSSGRVKLIPFDRHFTEEEQDKGLKKLFRRHDNMSGILNWAIKGSVMLRDEGLAMPERVTAAIASYRQETDIFGQFIADCTVNQDGSRLPTGELYAVYTQWAKDNGYRQMNNKNFFAELSRRFVIRRDGRRGNEVVGLVVDCSPNPFTE
jgi:putative DNA primase/helicase